MLSFENHGVGIRENMLIHILAQSWRRLIPPRTTQALLVAWQLHSDDKPPLLPTNK